ncbi:MAG: hypothetical protein H0A76_02110 [Candidatus Thiodubiliella endoseptemdiera]|uniref:Uncharacterized protein n=1 Tax=Candidatus Thiodubiliella endoseptemdiera TaxID=2738886 RepID=A0A853EZ33_9GAMM|nr:hypothetical protein [Candidatus Thiodubiliella endoseptemdiera]
MRLFTIINVVIIGTYQAIVVKVLYGCKYPLVSIFSNGSSIVTYVSVTVPASW